jgi:prepilin-type N-terminal cleavage/methylation domain-containing protein
MSRPWSWQRAGGFTLLEVLIAMTIVGLGVVTLLQIFSLGLRLQSRSMGRNEAVARGIRVMDQLLAQKRLESSASGRLGDDSRWISQVRTAPDEPTALALSENWELKEVSLELVLPSGGAEQRVELKTFRLVRRDNP